MPRPLHRLRDASEHWLANAINTPQGPTIITGQEQLRAFVYAPMGTRRGIQVAEYADRLPVSAAPLPVCVNANRWLVQCPYCGGAEFAWPEDPWFMCGSCFNSSVDGKWRPVVWPGDTEIAEVEAILNARPNPFSRNWDPFAEDTGDLRAQNVANGDPPEVRPEDWEGQPPGPRIARSRTAGERSGARWRGVVQKRAPQRSAIQLPPGWDAPTTIAVPESSDVGGEVLYPDAPLPKDSELGDRRGV